VVVKVQGDKYEVLKENFGKEMSVKSNTVFLP